MLIAVPDDELRQFVTEAVPSVQAVCWDWRAESMPAEAAGTRFLVSEYSATPPSPTVFAALPDLMAVQVPSSGVDGWLQALPPAVALCNGTGIHGQSTAEAAVAGVLALLRQLPTAIRRQAIGEWRPVVTEQLSGRRVVVLGAGDVAGRIAAITRALGCPTQLVGSYPRQDVRGPDELAGLLPDTDVLLIAMPLTDRTRGLVDAQLLRQLPDRAVVANVARGPIVDTAALTAEVLSGRLLAYLDVTDPEPLPAGHPLWTADNILLTPHTGGADGQWRRRYGELVVDQVRRLLAGTPLRNQITAPSRSTRPVGASRKA